MVWEDSCFLLKLSVKKSQSLMSSNFQSILDDSNEEQQSKRSNQVKEQSSQPLKTKQINKGRPKKRLQKPFISCQQLDSQSYKRNNIIDDRQCIFNEVVLRVQGQFIDFFKAINEKKGFVYCKQFRDKLKKCKGSRTEWTQQQKWDPTQQMNKLNQILPPDQLQNQNLKRLIMEVSSLHASEFTQEFYSIFLRLYSILKQSYPKINRKQIEKFAVQIYQNKDEKYIFFSRDFRKNVKETKKFPFTPLQSNEPYKILLLKSADAIQSLLFD